MGTLKRFDLKEYCIKYGLKVFIETGAGPAWSLSHAAHSNLFEKLLSVELDTATFQTYKQTYDSLPNTEVYNSTSQEFIEEVLPTITQPALFFLDAHFPGSEWGIYDGEPNADIRIPLEKEIEQLVKVKDVSKDVILIDDLRIYIDGPFEGGNWSERYRLGGNGIDFIYKHLGTTHDITLDYSDQGYIICTPKQSSL